MKGRTRSSVAICAAVCIALSSASSAAAQQAAAVGAAPPAAVPNANAAAPAAVKKAAVPAPKSLATWRGKVIAHLNSHKRTFGNAAGISTVAFSIDRSGRVLTARVVTSSGNSALDQEAVALTQRASPVPVPPSDIAGSPLYLKVPIRFAH